MTSSFTATPTLFFWRTSCMPNGFFMTAEKRWWYTTVTTLFTIVALHSQWDLSGVCVFVTGISLPGCEWSTSVQWRTKLHTALTYRGSRLQRAHREIDTVVYRQYTETDVVVYRQHTQTDAVVYWAVQAGLLTSLIFARHRLSPLADFTSGAYFLHNGRRWQWICEFYIANFKDILGGP